MRMTDVEALDAAGPGWRGGGLTGGDDRRQRLRLAILSRASIQRRPNMRTTTLMIGSVLLNLAICPATFAAEVKPSSHEVWSTISIVESWGPCPSSDQGGCARSWTIGADSIDVQVLKDGKTLSKQLNSVDLNAVKAIVGSSEFQHKLHSGFDCPPGPTDFFRVLKVAYSGGAQAQLFITGCEKNTLPGNLSDILSRY